jgi:hypothetical protein
VSVAEVVEIEANAPVRRLNQALRQHGPTLNLLYEYARAVPEEDAFLREALAGAIAGVLHGLLRRFWKDCGVSKHESKTAGPVIEGFSVPQIVSAAAKRHGKKHGLRTNAAWPLLEMLGADGGYARIDERIRTYAAALYGP